LELQPDFLEQPHGSVLLAQGRTKVLCTASIQDGTPRWLYGKGRGWLTAEYSLLPASTGDRTEREAARGKQGGRTVEIQRLIGRALRAVTDFEALGERTLWVDCDVLQADGGTRCAAISGAYVAAHRALDRFGLSRALAGSVAAVSVGIVEGVAVLGAAIGLERELREREAGLRTHLLVSLGSALFTIVSAYGFHSFLASGASVVRADPPRIAAQIVTGIGFLGAGAIIRQGLSVRGLTTAATLWVVAALGLAGGAGYYRGAGIATAFVLVALYPLRIGAYWPIRRLRASDRR